MKTFIIENTQLIFPCICVFINQKTQLLYTINIKPVNINSYHMKSKHIWEGITKYMKR